MHIYEDSEEYDILLQNGMFRSEKHLVAISHSQKDNDRKLKQLREKRPGVEFVVEGDNKTTWFISERIYPVVSGSNADASNEADDIAMCAAAMGVIPAPVDEPAKCPSCGSFCTEPSWGDHGYLQCEECGMVF